MEWNDHMLHHFGDDFRLLATSKPYDVYFFAISSTVLIIFSLEMMINTYATKRYAWGFYFWLDLFSTVSLIPDIGWIWEPLLSLVYSDTSQGLSSSTLLDASRASRAGTRATRLVRLVRLVRIVRIAKLLRQMHRRSNTERTQSETETTRSRIGTGARVTSRR